MIRNLANLTRLGLLVPHGEHTRRVRDQLADAERLRKARVHPIALLSALRTYAAGRGMRGAHTWTPISTLVEALDAAFYLSFGNVTPAGGRWLLALDVSGSMTFSQIAGVPGLTPRDASAAMSLVTAHVEADYLVMGFSTQFTPLAITRGQRLDDAIRTVSGLPFSGTDCALPMAWAMKHKVPVDTFVIYTDSETWFGDIHPAKALERYRQSTGIRARLVVVGILANGFSIADPEDPGMLDVVGFDTATPQLISDFASGSLRSRSPNDEFARTTRIFVVGWPTHRRGLRCWSCSRTEASP